MVSTQHRPSWRGHFTHTAKSSTKKLGVLFICRKFPPMNSCPDYTKDYSYPRMEHSSHIWVGSLSIWLLGRVTSKAITLINSLVWPQNLTRLPCAARYFFGFWAQELDACVSMLQAEPSDTQQSKSLRHTITVLPLVTQGWAVGVHFFPYTANLGIIYLLMAFLTAKTCPLKAEFPLSPKLLDDFSSPLLTSPYL